MGWSDNGRGRHSIIKVQDEEDMEWLTQLLLHADYEDRKKIVRPKLLPYDVHEVTVFDDGGDRIKTPIACRG